MDYDLQKLHIAYKQHGKIIIGLDFDDTIFPLSSNKTVIDRCRSVVNAIVNYMIKTPKERKPIICLYTNSDEQSLVYKKFITENYYRIPVDYVNESPVLTGNGKPFFNILLDDKAGLTESCQRLIKLTELT